MLGSCPAITATVAYGRQVRSVARKIRNAESRISPTDCGRAGGYSVSGIRVSYRGAAPACMSLAGMTANPTVAALLAEGAGRLRACGAGLEPAATPELDAQLLLAHVLGVPRAQLHAHPEAVPDTSRAREYRLLLMRRVAGAPLAYLTGRKEFWSLGLTVTPAVLIPRPETELLVERALALHPDAAGRGADLGTGSGAVALALASERPRWRIVATDASAEALAVARINAAALGLSVEVRHRHWYEPLARERFELIVSNPPYGAADDPALATPALAPDPRAPLP